MKIMMGSEAAESEAFDKAGWFNPNFLQPPLAKNSSPVHCFFDHSTRMRLSLKQCFVAEDALCLFSASIVHGPIFPSYFSAVHPGTPERGCNTGAFPPCPLKGGATRA